MNFGATQFSHGKCHKIGTFSEIQTLLVTESKRRRAEKTKLTQGSCERTLFLDKEALEIPTTRRERGPVMWEAKTAEEAQPGQDTGKWARQ